MKRFTTLLLVLGLLVTASTATANQPTAAMKADGWVSIFDGRTLEGWKNNEPYEGFRVEDGVIVSFGPRNHLYFMGNDELPGRLNNFELKLDVMSNNDGNSGVFVLSQWQEGAWPTSGFEVQINNSHRDPRKTGSLWSFVDILEAPHADDEWFNMHIICRGREIEVRINDKVLYAYVCQTQDGTPQPEPITTRNKRISQSGYIALQQHHDGSIVEFRNIFVKKLPD